MAINDSFLTRIKARDAETAWKLQPKTPSAFLLPFFDRGFQACAVVIFNGSAASTELTVLCDKDAAGDVILDDYMRNILARTAVDIHACRGAVILGLHTDGIAEVATWGGDAADCKRLGRWAGRELEALPRVPFTTWWGFGAGGTPTPLTAEELATLSPQARAWADVRAR